MRDLTEKTLGCQRAFEGRALTIDIVDIEMPNGRRSKREIIRHRGAVVVLGRRPDGRFILVRQYRRAIEQTLLEVVAGGVEIGENPDDAARREMVEESGYLVKSLTKLGVTVAIPGTSEEMHHHYFAELAAEPQEQDPDFDENLEPIAMTAEEIEAAIDTGALFDAKSIVIWYLWRRKQKLCTCACSCSDEGSSCGCK